jgi:hypothetical protein
MRERPGSAGVLGFAFLWNSKRKVIFGSGCCCSAFAFFWSSGVTALTAFGGASPLDAEKGLSAYWADAQFVEESSLGKLKHGENGHHFLCRKPPQARYFGMAVEVFVAGIDSAKTHFGRLSFLNKIHGIQT